jgi:hypothetical protein
MGVSPTLSLNLAANAERDMQARSASFSNVQ